MHERAKLETLLTALDASPRSLRHDSCGDLHALAGIWYVDFMDKYEANPAPPESYDGELSNIILEDELGADV